jgi:hypothetical protein
LDFSSRRNGFNTAQSFEPQNVPLLGLGTVELDSVTYRNVTEKNFTSHDTSAWLGSGTSGTVFKMNFMGKRQVAVKQIPKSDDPDEIKVRFKSLRIDTLYRQGGNHVSAKSGRRRQNLRTAGIRSAVKFCRQNRGIRKIGESAKSGNGKNRGIGKIG